MGNRTINLKDLTKEELIKIINIYQYNIDVLDVMIHDIDDVNLKDVSNWFDYIYRDLEDFKERGYTTVNPFDLKEYDIKNGYVQTNLNL